MHDPSFRVGAWVEIRPIDEILATLDERGMLDRLPFMPEMTKFCGRRLRVKASAHKTCDPTGAYDLMRMDNTVHLEARCDGSAHGGCQSGCLLFWKTAWLRPVEGPAAGDAREPSHTPEPIARSARIDSESGDARYVCQATEIVRAAAPLKATQMSQYVEDIRSGNVPVALALRALSVTAARAAATAFERTVKPRPKASPTTPGRSTAPLNLRIGELVRVRSEEEIVTTLDRNWKNRGLQFEREMLSYCGQSFHVSGRVEKLINEKTGRMHYMKSECLILDGLHCRGLSSRIRMFCPRGPLFYWREAWLERVEGV